MAMLVAVCRVQQQSKRSKTTNRIAEHTARRPRCNRTPDPTAFTGAGAPFIHARRASVRARIQDRIRVGKADFDMVWDEKTRESVLSRLSGYRYTHTLGVEQAARRLARQYGADETLAACAACFHDITKTLSREEQLNLCEKYDIIPCDVEKDEWKMLHGKTAAAIAAREYGAPREVVDAIAFHTTGRRDMTLLDKIIYLADYIEDNRAFDGVETARSLAKKDINEALLYCFDSSLCELVGRCKLIHADTVEARNALIAQGTRRT